MAAIRIKSLVLSMTMSLAGLTSASSAEKVVYQLGWVPGGSNAIEYVAKARGLFAAEGLDVDILSGNGGSDTLTRVAAGAADIGIVGIESVMGALAEQKLPVKVVFALYNKKPDSIHVPASSPVKAIADLKGRKLATASFSSSNVVWPIFAKRNGLDPASVELMKVDAAAVAPMMAAGQADALINWVTVAALDAAVMKEAGKGMRVIPWSDFGYEGYGQSLVVSENLLSKKPEVVKAFLRAFVKATAIAIADPRDAGNAIHEIVPEVDPVIASQEFAASIPLIQNEISKKDGLGAIEANRLKTTWDWVAQSRSLPQDAINPAALIDMTYLPK